MTTPLKTFLLEYDGIGMTSNQDQPSVALTTEQLTQLTSDLKARGVLPTGVIAVHGASLSLDTSELSEDGDYDASATIRILVEAESEKAAERLAQDFPSELFEGIVAGMVGPEGDTCGMTDTDALELVDTSEFTLQAAA